MNHPQLQLAAQLHAARRITWLSVSLNLSLGAAKCLIGFLAHSRALVADGVHSLTDLTSDVAVLVGLRAMATPPDADHPYGHHKAANLVTLLIAISILVFSFAIVADSSKALFDRSTVVPSWPALAMAIVSLLVKEFLFYRTKQVGTRVRSAMLLANAWHHRTDSVSSLITAVGLAAVMILGHEWSFLDALIGIGLGCYMLVVGGKFLFSAIHDLMDRAPAQAIIDDLREHVLSVPGAVGYHDFRVRRIGDFLEVDLHLLVPADFSILAAHQVAREVKLAILNRHPEVLNVLVHTEPDLPEHRRDRGVAERHPGQSNHGVDPPYLPALPGLKADTS